MMTKMVCAAELLEMSERRVGAPYYCITNAELYIEDKRNTNDHEATTLDHQERRPYDNQASRSRRAKSGCRSLFQGV